MNGPNILRLMLLASVLNLFTVGYSAVGFPFMIRTVLGFDATVYGICDGITGGRRGSSAPSLPACSPLR